MQPESRSAWQIPRCMLTGIQEALFIPREIAVQQLGYKSGEVIQENKVTICNKVQD